MRRPKGEILLDGESILAMSPDERAAKGVFLAFQYPVEIPGVATMTFLRTALNAQRKARGESGAVHAGIPQARARGRRQARHRPGDAAPGRQCRLLRRREEAQRDFTRWLSCGRAALRVLDETDSGLDIDALKIVADGVNRLRSPDRAMVVITHYQRLLDYIVPDVVHVLSRGRIVKTGGKELALELEAKRITRRSPRVKNPRSAADQE